MKLQTKIYIQLAVISSLIIGIGFSLGVPIAEAANCTWTGATNTRWDEATNWSCGTVPVAGDTATINAGGNQPTISIGTVESDITVNSGATLTWTSGSIGSEGTLNIAVGATMVMTSTSVKYLYGHLNNQGTVAWHNGTFYANKGSSVANSGLFDIRTDEDIDYNSSGTGDYPTFVNSGTLRKSWGSWSETTDLSFIDPVLTNTGTIEVQDGYLRLRQLFYGTSRSSGAFSVADGAALDFYGDYILEPTATLEGAGQVYFSYGTTTLEGNIATSDQLEFGLYGGGVGGTLNVNKQMTWESGNIASEGTMNIAVGATLVITNTSSKYVYGHLNNQGTVAWHNGTFYANKGSSVANSGLFDIRTDEDIDYNSSGTGDYPTFVNSGTLRKSWGSWSETTDLSFIDPVLTNTGTIEVQDGYLRLRQLFYGTSRSSGAFSVADGAALDFYGDYILEPTATLEGAGQVYFSYGTTTLEGNIATSDQLEFGLYGGGVGGTLNVNKQMTWESGNIASEGTMNIAVGATLVITNTSSKYVYGHLNNQGTVAWHNGTFYANKGSSVANSGLFDIRTDEDIDYNSSGTGDYPTFVNSGTLRKSWGSWSETTDLSFIDPVLTNTGTIEVQDGYLRLRQLFYGTSRSSGAFSVADGAALDFYGDYILEPTATLEGAGQVYFSGGTIDINGSYNVPTTTVSGGTVNFNVNTTFPSINITNGTMNVVTATISGPFINSSGTFEATSGFITFNGGLSQTLVASSTTTFNDVLIEEGTTIVETGSRGSTVNGSLTNNGLILSEFPVFSSRSLGLSRGYLYVGTLGSLDRIWVEHVGQDHPQATGSMATGEYWRIRANGIAYVVHIQLPHTEIVPENTQVCGLKDGTTEWDCRQDSTSKNSVRWDDFSWAGTNLLDDWVWALAIDRGETTETKVEANREATLVSVNGDVGIHFPQGSVTQQTDFIYTPNQTPTDDTTPPDFQFAGKSFKMDPYRQGNPVSNFFFKEEILITVQYDDSDVADMNENNLQLYFLDGSNNRSWSNNLLTVKERDPGRNRLTVAAATPGEYSLFGPTGCNRVASVDIVGPKAGQKDVAYEFSAVISPTYANSPVTYEWSPEPVSGQGTTTAVYQQSSLGNLDVSVTTKNCEGGVATGNATLSIVEAPPASVSDSYESDNDCSAGTTLATDGIKQYHTFHSAGDEDWLVFPVTAGVEYIIEATVPPTSTADVDVEMYGSCGGDKQDSQNNNFSADVRLQLVAPTSGNYYLRLANSDSSIYGTNTAYYISVEPVETEANGAFVLVAGKLKDDDPVQPNIHHVTNAIYNLALDNGCTPDDIYYLASDTSLFGVDSVVTPENLEAAITQWAPNHVGDKKRFTLFMMDHGGQDKFYLNGRGETVSPEELDGWLTNLETSVPDVEVNVMFDACYSGSFIEPDQTISKDGRLIMSSTGPKTLAYATTNGAIFSDKLIDILAKGQNISNAFQESQWTATQAHPEQTPWLDVNGNGIANEEIDVNQAISRGFACASAPKTEKWSPQVKNVQVNTVGESSYAVWAQVEDDKNSAGQGVQEVWGMLYPPSYTPPTQSEELVLPEEGLAFRVNMYATNAPNLYGGFPARELMTEKGTYRLVIQAVDDEGLLAKPQVVEIQNGTASQSVYLPVVVK